jgi:hypothetical protein
MISTATEKMGKVTTTTTVTNQVDQIFASRGFIPNANAIAQLGLVLQADVEAKTAVGIRKAKLFKEVILQIAGRQGVYNCMSCRKVRSHFWALSL